MNERWSQTRLLTEASVRNDLLCAIWCIEHGLLRAGPYCTTHDQQSTINKRTRNGRDSLYWCCSICKDQVSVRIGSIFEEMRLPLGKALMLALCFAQDLELVQAQRALSWSPEEAPLAITTIVRFYARLRSFIETFMDSREKIGGPGIIVQVDEALLGRRKYNRGRLVPGAWCLGMIAEDGSAKFEIVENRTADTLLEVITRNVRQGSIIHTDEWKSYNKLPTLGYFHDTVNHSKRFVSESGAHTQRIEAQWRQIRRRFHSGGVRHRDLRAYLAEYSWRRACRLSGNDSFESLLSLLQA